MKDVLNKDGSPMPDPGLRAPRFSLVMMFALVACVAVALTIWRAVGPAVGLTLLLILLALGLHVAGNAIGTRLRQRGTQHSLLTRQQRADEDGSWTTSAKTSVEPHHFAPVTRLSRRASLGWFTLLATLMGGIAGSLGGGWWLKQMYPDTATPATLVLGGLATGALGALWTFWMISMLQVFGGALWQAHRHGDGN